ncbi:alpha/beta hydrolase [Mycobacterium sp. 94-17]|uniref:alpha/beta fold hydrolase n=1 Tax=Mycobacterium sp. 94-17 TaxID=2986147 RepID=UPI002D1F2CA6|nr:alpha/beta hydrolase [Mycobacterium sp. 94-17]MEB4211593.1 alpha/beta hydrolase [Mycobacterium sp. 94-17]
MWPAIRWAAGDGLRAKTMSHVQAGAGMARLIRPVVPLMLRSPTVRRHFFQTPASHGDRVSARRGVEIVDDFLGCGITREIFSTDDQRITPFDALPCPITVAWAENDVAIPAADYAANARERLPGATFVTLADTGHDPMMDDPGLVGDTILSVTRPNP